MSMLASSSVVKSKATPPQETQDHFYRVYEHDVLAIERTQKETGVSKLPVWRVIGTTGYKSPRPGLILLNGLLPTLANLTGEQQAVVEQTLLPLVGLGSDLVPEHSAKFGSVANVFCSEAEPWFADAIEQVRDPKQAFHDWISVYHTASEESPTPLLLSKSDEEASAITLVPIQIGKITLPAGTIVGVDESYQRSEAKSDATGVFSSYTVDSDTPLFIEPGRISPWAYSNIHDRELFGVASRAGIVSGYWADRTRICAEYCLDDFRQAADTVMQFCGVTQPLEKI